MHKRILDLLLDWEFRLQQAQRDDRVSPGFADELRRVGNHLVAETIRACSEMALGWTGRADDARRIPDMLHEQGVELAGRGSEFGDAIEVEPGPGGEG